MGRFPQVCQPQEKGLSFAASQEPKEPHEGGGTSPAQAQINVCGVFPLANTNQSLHMLPKTFTDNFSNFFLVFFWQNAQFFQQISAANVFSVVTGNHRGPFPWGFSVTPRMGEKKARPTQSWLEALLLFIPYKYKILQSNPAATHRLRCSFAAPSPGLEADPADPGLQTCPGLCEGSCLGVRNVELPSPALTAGLTTQPQDNKAAPNYERESGTAGDLL